MAAASGSRLQDEPKVAAAASGSRSQREPKVMVVASGSHSQDEPNATSMTSSVVSQTGQLVSLFRVFGFCHLFRNREFAVPQKKSPTVSGPTHQMKSSSNVQGSASQSQTPLTTTSKKRQALEAAPAVLGDVELRPEFPWYVVTKGRNVGLYPTM